MSMAAPVSAFITVLLSLVSLSQAQTAPQQVCRSDHVLVRYTGIDPQQAEAISGVVETARQIAIDRYAFDMPETIEVRVGCDAGNKVRLFNDGHDRLDLSLYSAEQLRPPSESGIFHLYGLCHEVGHMAMYRTIPRHDWLSTAGAEGWAHYIGSVLVDGVYDTAGEPGWCYPYDYQADGTARLDAQLAQPDPGEIARAAGLWRELVTLIGADQMAPLFQAWGAAEIDPADPGAALRRVLLEQHDDAGLADWWNRAEALLIRKQPRSEFTAHTAKPTELMRQPRDLAWDDGKTTGKRSIAGGGHAVTFDAPGPGWYLTQVNIYGSRYGQTQPPKEDFSVWLCDEDGRVIREFLFPYSKFARGNPRWVLLMTEPTEVPARFTVCVGFNPTGTKGVYVHHAGSATDMHGTQGGQSRVGLPGRFGEPMGDDHWMIRVRIDQRTDADALRE